MNQNTKTNERHIANINCPRCNGSTYTTIVSPHIKLSCINCGFIKFIKQPWNNFKMPIGKYKGMTLEKIKEMDIEYLRWCSLNITGSIKNRIDEALTNND